MRICHEVHVQAAPKKDYGSAIGGALHIATREVGNNSGFLSNVFYDTRRFTMLYW